MYRASASVTDESGNRVYASDRAYSAEDILDHDAKMWDVLGKLIEELAVEQAKYKGTAPKPGPGDRRDPAPKPPIVGATPEETAALEDTARRMADANREVMEGGGSGGETV